MRLQSLIWINGIKIAHYVKWCSSLIHWCRLNHLLSLINNHKWCIITALVWISSIKISHKWINFNHLNNRCSLKTISNLKTWGNPKLNFLNLLLNKQQMPVVLLMMLKTNYLIHLIRWLFQWHLRQRTQWRTCLISKLNCRRSNKSWRRQSNKLKVLFRMLMKMLVN